MMVDVARGKGMIAGREVPVTLTLGSHAWKVVKEQLTEKGV